MLDLHPTTLAAVVNSAKLSAAVHPRWLTAIDRAVVELAENPWIARGDDSSLIIASPSGKCYTSNGICQCTAFTYGNPCWHRAASRLVRLHDEAQARQQRRAAYEQACAEMDELYA
jgi:hypothetical protein